MSDTIPFPVQPKRTHSLYRRHSVTVEYEDGQWKITILKPQGTLRIVERAATEDAANKIARKRIDGLMRYR